VTETLEQRAVARCADEMARAHLYRLALRGLGRSRSYHGIDFIQLAQWALYDQMFGHAIKVLDRREKAGFWYLISKKKDRVPKLCANHHVLLGNVRIVEKKLKLIRDKTHLHLDVRGVMEPKKLWKEAGLTREELEKAIDASLRLLCALHKEIRGAEFHVPYYDGSDARRIAEHAYKYDLLSKEPVHPSLAALFDP
jgi:hypothetical protein